MKLRPGRRLALGVLTSFLITFACAHSAMAAGKATDFLRNFGEQLVTIVNSDAPIADKKAKVLPILERDVDVDAIGQGCLGRYWRVATPEQRTHYLSLFHQVLLNTITDKLGDYKGVSFKIGAATAMGDDESVDAVLMRPHQPEANMQWVVSESSGSPRIVDVIGEGASLKLTQRQEYEAFIVHNGGSVEALIGALQRQLQRHDHP